MTPTRKTKTKMILTRWQSNLVFLMRHITRKGTVKRLVMDFMIQTCPSCIVFSLQLHHVIYSDDPKLVDKVRIEQCANVGGRQIVPSKFKKDGDKNNDESVCSFLHKQIIWTFPMTYNTTTKCQAEYKPWKNGNKFCIGLSCWC